MLLLFIMAPILMVVALSFTSGSTLQFPPPGWSLRWYESAWGLLSTSDVTTERLRESLGMSFVIGATTAVVAVIVGLPAAYTLARLRFRGKLFVEQMITLPLAFPLVVLGVALLVMISQLRIEVGFWRLVVAHVVITIPFVVRNCAASLVGLNASLEEAAVCLGANRLRTFCEIILPLMRPGVLAGALLAFIISFNEFTVAYFLYTVEVFPFPIWLFTKSNTSLDPTIFALSALIVLFDAFLIWILDRAVGKQGVSL
ncbi:MAG: ABC transporter permease [Gammaproteobacteria bacterium]|nr:ABC transporter permease [Gammaproteobacteria bacterium]NIR82021.1 ABC transporter permease [Gammaproteobacteria bacterium]NIR89249.1 ABC transporter permease [Gammaproteobacteria bacterium]NIU03131.1 ABC transporter permease [Gammaproteobacteria bacterium]NIV50647.1 ABC transporter permease subunit [Gammaproteobacteria bacterium]